MFVARDANDYKKSYLLPQLSFEGESNPKKCLLRDEYGKRNKERRRAFAEVKNDTYILFMAIEITI